MESRKALDLSVQEVVYAGLEALQVVADLDLCAYLHASPVTGPQLFLGVPALSAAGGPQAFTIYHELQDILDRPFYRPPADGSGLEVVTSEIGGHPSLVVATAGIASRGAFAVGRATPFRDDERAALVRLARAQGTALHRLIAAIERTAAAAIERAAIEGAAIEGAAIEGVAIEGATPN